jgi:hypothetical protein
LQERSRQLCLQRYEKEVLDEARLQGIYDTAATSPQRGAPTPQQRAATEGWRCVPVPSSGGCHVQAEFDGACMQLKMHITCDAADCRISSRLPGAQIQLHAAAGLIC